jgi:hypothetical protein
MGDAGGSAAGRLGGGVGGELGGCAKLGRSLQCIVVGDRRWHDKAWVCIAKSLGLVVMAIVNYKPKTTNCDDDDDVA